MNNKINQNNKTDVSRNIKFLEVGGNINEALENIYYRLYKTSYVNRRKYIQPYYSNYSENNNHNMQVIFDVEIETTIKVVLGRIRDIYSNIPDLEKISDDHYIIGNINDLGIWKRYVGEDTSNYLILNIRLDDNSCYLQVLSKDELTKVLNPINQIDLNLFDDGKNNQYINSDILENILDEYIRLSINPNFAVYLGDKKPKKVLVFGKDSNYNGKEVEKGDLLVFSDYTDTGYVVSQRENHKIHKRILESIFGFEIEEI